MIQFFALKIEPYFVGMNSLLIKIICVVLCTHLSFYAQGQEVYIPDTSFVHQLILDGVDQNNDGKIQVIEALKVDSLSIGHWPNIVIYKLTGIEAFINLKSLRVGNHKVDSIILGHCLKLESLQIVDNDSLIYLNLGGTSSLKRIYVCDNYKLSHVDISDNVDLSELNLNSNQLTTLDVSKNVDLIYLSAYNNNLAALDVSHNELLIVLEVSFNQFITLDVSKNINLIYLYSDCNKLHCLDVSNNIKLENLGCSSNPISTLSLDNNPNLSFLFLGNTHLSGINLEHCLKLRFLLLANDTVGSNYFNYENPAFTELDLSKQPAFAELVITGHSTLQKVCFASNFDVVNMFNHFHYPNIAITTNCSNASTTNITVNKSRLCLRETVQFTLNQPDTTLSYQIDYGDGKGLIAPVLNYQYQKPGKYTARLVSAIGCAKYMASVNVLVDSMPPTSLWKEDTICLDTSFVLDAGKGYQHYLWQNGDTNSSQQLTKPVKYKVSVSNTCGVSTDSILVPLIKKGFTLGSNRSCVKDEHTFELNHIQYPVKAYLWNYGNGVSAATSKTSYQYTKSGAFQASLILNYQCYADTSSAPVFIDDFPLINMGSDSVLICHDEPVLLDAGEGFTSVVWQDGSTNQNYNATQSGRYIATVSNTCGSQSDSVNITTIQLNVPNIITPNGDGLNESLYIYKQIQKRIHFNVINIWGQEVFDSNDYQNNWDAHQLSDGIYYFTSFYEGCPHVKGWVQVAR